MSTCPLKDSLEVVIISDELCCLNMERGAGGDFTRRLITGKVGKIVLNEGVVVLQERADALVLFGRCLLRDECGG